MIDQRDPYGSFHELAIREREGHDYRRLAVPRDSATAIIAPHGGGIEPGTSEISRALAGAEFALYCFEGLKLAGNEALHVASTRFDEPRCAQLVAGSQTVVAVHGCAGDHRAVYVGGLDGDLKVRVVRALERAGFDARQDASNHGGRHARNICNRGSSGKGLQLEITAGLRRAMFKGLRRPERETTRPPFDRFVTAVRAALLEAESRH